MCAMFTTRVYVRRNGVKPRKKIGEVVTRGRFLFLHDVSRAPPRPYTRSISILGKSTLGIENRNESARRGGAQSRDVLQEVGGREWTAAREETNERKKTMRTLCLRRYIYNARLLFFFYSATQLFDFSEFSIFSRIFEDFVRKSHRRKGSVKSNSAGVQRLSSAENILCHVLKKLYISAPRFLPRFFQ